MATQYVIVTAFGLACSGYGYPSSACASWASGYVQRGVIEGRLPALLSRLDLELDAWLATMVGWRQMHGRAVGHRAVRDEMAVSQGLRWIKNRCTLFAERRAS